MPSGTNTAVVYTPRFYPTLSSVVSEDQIPDILGFIKDGLFLILNKVHYKDLQYNKSINGDAAFYSLSIVTKDRLDFEIPGTEVFLVLNPDVDGADDNISSFPITVEYEWKVLGYLRAFSLNQFDFSPRAIFDMALRILNISEEQALANFINIFAEADATTTSLQRFVNDVNTELSTNLTAPTNETTLTEVAQEIYAQTQNFASVAAFGTYILNSDAEQTKAKVKLYFKSFLPQDIEEFVKDILIPKFRATLALSAAIEFPRKVLQPVYPLGHANAYEVIPEDPNDAFLDKVQLSFGEALFYADTEQGLGYNMDISLNTSTPAMIGNTGLIININNVKIDLSRTQNIAEATAAGRPNDFVGAYISEASIALPEKWFKQQSGTTAQIYARNLLVGTGGVSGNIGLEAVGTLPVGTEPELSLKLGSNSGFEIALNRFNVAFQQNAIISSDVKGSITIPNFKEIDDNGDTVAGDLKLGVMMHFTDDGDFSITADPQQDNFKIGIKDVFSFDVDTFTVGRQDDRYYAEVSGGLSITADFGGDSNLPKGLEIPKLRIWEDGSFEIPLDTPPFPSEISLKFGPVELYVSNMHVGSYEKNGRPYKFFGFDGGIDTNPTSVDAKGTGIKLYFSVDDGNLDIFLRIQRIDIDLIIPAKGKIKKEDDNSTPTTTTTNSDAEEAVLLLKGFLAMRDGGGGTTEYAGGVDITLPRLNFRGSAAMRLNPQKPNFIIDAQIEMNNGIPLGSTGLSIYGFRGLVGKNYVATKQAANPNLTDDDPWWKYYKEPDTGVNVEKFDGDLEGFSLGAGVSLATTPDAGFSFSSKLFFLLSLPNLFLFEGQAGMLQDRIGLSSDDEPPFFALLTIDSTSVEAAIGVDYKTPDDGAWFKRIAHIYGIMEIGFFRGNASAWYVNIGRDLPESMRVQATIAELFQAYAYLMLSSKEIKMGAGVSFGKEYTWPKNKKTIKLTLESTIDITAKINFNPQQFGGSLALGGNFGIRMFGVGFSAGADAILTGETPQPYIIIGRLGVSFRAFGKDRNFHLEVEWTRDPNPNTAELPIMSVVNGEIPAKATNILTKDQYSLLYAESDNENIPNLESSDWSGNFEDYGIPLDSFIDLEFLKGVKPFTTGDSITKIGGVTTGYENLEVFPPEKAKTIPLEHRYEVDNIVIKYWDGDVWQDYHVYDALTSLEDLPFINPSDLTNKKHGYWQIEKPRTYSKLRVLAQTPISYMTQTAVPTPLEEFGITYHTLFCEDEGINMSCYNWKQFNPNKIYAKDLLHVLEKGLAIQLDREGRTQNTSGNNFNTNPNLMLRNGGNVKLFFNTPIAQSILKLKTELDEVTFRYYKRVQTITANDQAPTMSWQLLHEITKLKSEINNHEIIYNHTDIEKIEISIPENAPQEFIDFTNKDTFIIEVCWLTKYAYEYNQTLVDNDGVQQEADELLEGLDKVIQPIWRPNTNYVIQVKVLDKLSLSNNQIQEYEKYHNYGFRTYGPIGHFHENDAKYENLIPEQKDQYRLADLRSYVDFTKSYPNADGNLLSAKPLFYEHPKLSLFFVKPYVYTMFNDFGSYDNLPNTSSKLNAIIKDPVDQPSAVVSGTRTATAQWRETPYGAVEQDVQMINNLTVNGVPCVETIEVTPPNLAADLIPDVLKPLKTYTAIINSEFEDNASEVLRYTFETSRYPDFKTQIGSHILSDTTGLKAVYTIELESPNYVVNGIKKVFNDTIRPDHFLYQNFANHFDRLFFALGLQAQEVPLTTEANIIRYEGQILGVWLRSPEPFNDPKIKAETITNLMEIIHPSMNNNAFKTIISKDGANLFISVDTMDLQNGELSIQIPYLEFDGQIYQISGNPAHQADAILVEL